MTRALTINLFVLTLLAGCAQFPAGTSDNERMFNAIAIDDVGFVRDAVKSGSLRVNQTITTPGFKEGAPLILVAARFASLDTMRYLISAGANLNARAATGETALMLASYFSYEDSQQSAASSARYEEAVRMLVDAGASLENEPYNYTPLAYAAYQGNDRIVRYLIQRGARVNGDAENGVVYVNTPLMMAAIQGHLDTALWLLRAGADPRVRVYLGNTAAELAQKNKHDNLTMALKCAERLSPGEAFSQRCR